MTTKAKQVRKVALRDMTAAQREAHYKGLGAEAQRKLKVAEAELKAAKIKAAEHDKLMQERNAFIEKQTKRLQEVIEHHTALAKEHEALKGVNSRAEEALTEGQEKAAKMATEIEGLKAQLRITEDIVSQHSEARKRAEKLAEERDKLHRGAVSLVEHKHSELVKVPRIIRKLCGVVSV